MDSENGQGLDSIFGQAPAFALTDNQVNPAVVEYLSGVRQEALRTSGVKVAKKKHEADIYDEDEIIIKRVKVDGAAVAYLEQFNTRIDDWLSWFKNTRETVLNNGPINQHHTEHTMNLLLNYLKLYLCGNKQEKDNVSDLVKLLKDVPTVANDDNLELDEEWAESVVQRLRKRHVKGINDIKMIILNADVPTPVGFKQWYQYLQQNEPSQAAFGPIINTRNIWVLVQYMTQEWVKTISKCKKPPQAIRFSLWLLYILFNIPENLSADHTSNLRNLGKKCQAIIKKELEPEAQADLKQKAPLLASLPASNFEDIGGLKPPEDLDIIRLTVSVIAITYRQRDLIS